MTEAERLRAEMKGSPMALTESTRPVDPNEPTDDLRAWCEYHGIEYNEED